MLSWQQRIGVVSGNIFEFYDIAVYTAIASYLTTALRQIGIANAGAIVWGVFALRFLVRPLGGLLIGMYADRVGRRKALILTSCITGTATLSLACLPISPGHADWIPLALLLLQAAQAFSFGGEYPAIIGFLLTDAKRGQQAAISTLIVASSIVGVVLSLTVVLTLTQILTPEHMQRFGWRIPVALGVVNLLMGLYFRLGLREQVVIENTARQADLAGTLCIFLLTIPAAVVFYVQTLAASLLKSAIRAPWLQPIFPLVLNLLLLACMGLVTMWVIRYTNPAKAMRAGVGALILGGMPLYAALNTHSVAVMAIAMGVLTLIAALILNNLAAVLFDEIRAYRQITTLALGYNLALSIFGGLSPLLVATLMSHGVVFVGAYVSASGLAYPLAQAMQRKRAADKSWQPSAARPDFHG